MVVLMGSGFSLFGAIGDAETQHVLVGKRFSSDSGTDLVGTMVDQGAVNQTIKVQNGLYTIPQGYHNGNGKITVTLSNLTPDNVKKGVSVGGVVGIHDGYQYLTLPAFSSDGGTLRAVDGTYQYHLEYTGFNLASLRRCNYNGTLLYSRNHSYTVSGYSKFGVLAKVSAESNLLNYYNEGGTLIKGITLSRINDYYIYGAGAYTGTYWYFLYDYPSQYLRTYNDAGTILFSAAGVGVNSNRCFVDVTDEVIFIAGSSFVEFPYDNSTPRNSSVRNGEMSLSVALLKVKLV